MEDALPRFRRLGEVREAHAIGLAPVTSVPNDSLWSRAWHLYQPSRKDVHALEAWDLTLGDTSVVVALIDTGLIPYHPDIGGTTAGSSGQIWTNWAEAGALLKMRLELAWLSTGVVVASIQRTSSSAIETFYMKCWN